MKRASVEQSRQADWKTGKNYSKSFAMTVLMDILGSVEPDWVCIRAAQPLLSDDTMLPPGLQRKRDTL